MKIFKTTCFRCGSVISLSLINIILQSYIFFSVGIIFLAFFSLLHVNLQIEFEFDQKRGIQRICSISVAWDGKQNNPQLTQWSTSSFVKNEQFWEVTFILLESLRSSNFSLLRNTYVHYLRYTSFALFSTYLAFV